MCLSRWWTFVQCQDRSYNVLTCHCWWTCVQCQVRTYNECITCQCGMEWKHNILRINSHLRGKIIGNCWVVIYVTTYNHNDNTAFNTAGKGKCACGLPFMSKICSRKTDIDGMMPTLSSLLTRGVMTTDRATKVGTMTNVGFNCEYIWTQNVLKFLPDDSFY